MVNEKSNEHSDKKSIKITIIPFRKVLSTYSS